MRSADADSVSVGDDSGRRAADRRIWAAAGCLAALTAVSAVMWARATSAEDAWRLRAAEADARAERAASESKAAFRRIDLAYRERDIMADEIAARKRRKGSLPALLEARRDVPGGWVWVEPRILQLAHPMTLGLDLSPDLCEALGISQLQQAALEGVGDEVLAEIRAEEKSSVEVLEDGAGGSFYRIEPSEAAERGREELFSVIRATLDSTQATALEIILAGPDSFLTQASMTRELSFAVDRDMVAIEARLKDGGSLKRVNWHYPRPEKPVERWGPARRYAHLIDFEEADSMGAAINSQAGEQPGDAEIGLDFLAE